jgi:hypothetical protein
LTLVDILDDVTVSTEGVQYRRPDVYNSLFQSVSVAVEDGNEVYAFETVFSKSVQTFVKVHAIKCLPIYYVQTVKIQSSVIGSVVNIRLLPIDTLVDVVGVNLMFE